MNRLSVFVNPGRTFNEGIARVRIAESLGYESVWVIQLADREATVVCAAYAAATSKIKIGTGVLPTYPRTPVVTAQTAATLDELSGGRFILGLGPSHQITIEMWHGMELSKPLKSVREYVTAVRSIMQGQPFIGDIYKTAFQFQRYEPLRRDMPIYISCLSPKMCELAGEVADGAVLWMCAPNYIRDVVVPQISKGRAKVGKTMDGFEVVAAVPVSLTDNIDGGRGAFRKASAVYWSLPFYRAAIDGAGLGAELEAFDKGGVAAVSDDALHTFGGIGDISACEKAITTYREAGVTLPALSVMPQYEGASDFETTLKALI